MDETFTSPFGPELTLSAMVCQPDGKVVVAGRFSTNPPVAADEIKRLLPSGALDTHFAASIENDFAVRLHGDGTCCEGVGFQSKLWSRVPPAFRRASPYLAIPFTC